MINGTDIDSDVYNIIVAGKTYITLSFPIVLYCLYSQRYIDK